MLKGWAKKRYQRQYMRRQRERLRSVRWDQKKYPQRWAWERAVLRVVAAKEYREEQPQEFHNADVRYFDLGWQYENELGKGKRPPRPPKPKRQKRGKGFGLVALTRGLSKGAVTLLDQRWSD